MMKGRIKLDDLDVSEVRRKARPERKTTLATGPFEEPVITFAISAQATRASPPKNNLPNFPSTFRSAARRNIGIINTNSIKEETEMNETAGRIEIQNRINLERGNSRRKSFIGYIQKLKVTNSRAFE